jgi:hypothetical protein
MIELPVIDIQKFKETGDKALCDQVAECLHKYGVLCLRDNRATEENNAQFIDMMERYFEATDFVQDARPDLHFQVGVTPELKERARNHCARAEKMAKENAPVTLCPPELDKKSRFFWRMGDRPTVRYHSATREV